MTLLEVADAITSGVQRAAQRDVIVERVARLKRVELTLEQLMPAVVEAMSLASAVAASGLSISTDGFAFLRDRISDASRHADQDDLDAPALEQLLVDVRTEVASVKSTATILWHELVDRRIPGRQGIAGLADTYLQLDPGDILAKELRHTVGVAQQLSNALPTSDALERLDSVATRIPQLLSDLVGNDPSVRSFAERVARGGAALDSLTPEVARWIASKGFEQSFKIVPGGPVL